MSQVVTNITKKDVRELAAEVNRELQLLNRVNRIKVDFEDGYIYVRIGKAEQIERGCHTKSIGGEFKQPRQAHQCIIAFLSGVKQPVVQRNPNKRLVCGTCDWAGLFEELKPVTLGKKNPVVIHCCPFCDSHNLIGI